MLIIIALAVLVGLLTQSVIVGLAVFVGAYLFFWLVAMLFGIAIMGVARKGHLKVKPSSTTRRVRGRRL